MQTDHTDIVRHYRPLPELVPAHWQTGATEAADGAAPNHQFPAAVWYNTCIGEPRPRSEHSW